MCNGDLVDDDGSGSLNYTVALCMNKSPYPAVKAHPSRVCLSEDA
jgi:hypothetical protein